MKRKLGGLYGERVLQKRKRNGIGKAISIFPGFVFDVFFYVQLGLFTLSNVM